MRPISYFDPFVARLAEDIAALIEGDSLDPDPVVQGLQTLAAANSPTLRAYWQRTEPGMGVPDSAFRRGSLFHFHDTAPVRGFRTSGTSGRTPGLAEYSRRGLELMDCSIINNARRHLFAGLERPTVVRLVPRVEAAPQSIMAYGMDLLARTFGDPASSTCVIGPDGLDLDGFGRTLDRAVSEGRPVVLIGGSFACVHLYDALKAGNRSWTLPQGSRVVDAGGFKGRSRELDVSALRGCLTEVLGVGADGFTNLFGMTELASQLYDSQDQPVGMRGERPKGIQPFIRPRVRDTFTWQPLAWGPGLLEIADLAVIDRPYAVLTGDWGIACEAGVAVTGRVVAAESRGCALTFEAPQSLLQDREEDRRVCC